MDNELSDRPRCIVCGEVLPRLTILHEDPYCSSVCAMRDHGLMVKDGSQYNHVVPIGSRREPPR